MLGKLKKCIKKILTSFWCVPMFRVALWAGAWLVSFGKEYDYLSLFQFIDIVLIAETFVGVIDVYSKLETNEHFDKCKGVYFIFVSILVPVIVLVSVRLCIANNYSYTWMLYALAILLMLCKLMVELSFYNSKRWFIVEDIVVKSKLL